MVDFVSKRKRSISGQSKRRTRGRPKAANSKVSMPSGCSTTPRMCAWNTAASPDASTASTNHWSGIDGFAWSTIRWKSQLPRGAL